MNIRVNILPEYDNYHSSPKECKFLIDSDEGLVEVEFDDRVITFKQDDFRKLVKAFDV